MPDGPVPLIDLSDQDLLNGYREAVTEQEAALTLYAEELGRRATDRSARAIQTLTEQLVGLTVWIVRLTIGIVALTVLVLLITIAQLDIALGGPGSPTASVAPDFRDVGDPTFYCTQTPTKAGPCIATEIFVSQGGSGTEVAVFSASPQSCRAVIPSTPKGSETSASCVLPLLVASGSRLSVSVAR